MTASLSAPTTEANIRLVRRLMDEAVNKGNLAICDELVAPDVVEHQRGSANGVEGTKQVFRVLRSWFDDLYVEIQDVIAQEDMVWFRHRATGTNTGHFMGFPPTGRHLDIDVIDVVRIRNGRIVEHWGVPDQLGAALQMGVFPVPPRDVAEHCPRPEPCPPTTTTPTAPTSRATTEEEQ
jgi:predicted ester cyclase